jgi:hypothetical protein
MSSDEETRADEVLTILLYASDAGHGKMSGWRWAGKIAADLPPIRVLEVATQRADDHDGRGRHRPGDLGW